MYTFLLDMGSVWRDDTLHGNKFALTQKRGEPIMECPVCHHRNHVEIDTHADGFASNLNECGDCGAVWTVREVKVLEDVLIHGATGPVR